MKAVQIQNEKSGTEAESYRQAFHLKKQLSNVFYVFSGFWGSRDKQNMALVQWNLQEIVDDRRESRILERLALQVCSQEVDWRNPNTEAQAESQREARWV